MATNPQPKMSDQIANVRHEIGQAAALAGRNGDDITLVAVSKTFSPDIIKPVLQAGHRVFGENRVQEAAGKWPDLREEFKSVELHLIGPLQTNKTAVAVKLFDCIETLDRPKLARAIAAELKKQKKSIELFVQVNIGAEPQKAGVAVKELPDFLELCRLELNLSITGLMCIPPVEKSPLEYFSRLAELAANNDLAKLSMGMSADFPAAIMCGATHVRVGTAIFGQR